MNSFSYFKSYDVNFRTLGNGRYEYKDVSTNQWNLVKEPLIGRMLAKDGYQISREEAEKTGIVYKNAFAYHASRGLSIWKPKPVQLMCIIRPEPLILMVFVLLSQYKRF
ncbi:MAG: hypothetical protein H0T62_05450 [Parachlamydiaceae bacterium]|nr:hypothetical protein [Parachlamydiaceae bacterium]